MVFTPIADQHLFGDPVGPGGQSCDGFNQPLLLEFPSLEPPRARMNATREHHVRLTKRLATTGLHTNRADACRYGSQGHTGESFHTLHVDTWIGGAGIRSAGPEEIISRTNKQQLCERRKIFAASENLLQGSIQKHFAKNFSPGPRPVFPRQK